MLALPPALSAVATFCATAAATLNCTVDAHGAVSFGVGVECHCRLDLSSNVVHALCGVVGHNDVKLQQLATVLAATAADGTRKFDYGSDVIVVKPFGKCAWKDAYVPDGLEPENFPTNRYKRVVGGSPAVRLIGLRTALELRNDGVLKQRVRIDVVVDEGSLADDYKTLLTATRRHRIDTLPHYDNFTYPSGMPCLRAADDNTDEQRDNVKHRRATPALAFSF